MNLARLLAEVQIPDGRFWPKSDAKNLLSILLWDRVRSAIERPVRTISPNAGFEELPFRTGPFEALNCRDVDFAVMVVGRLEPHDHVSRRLVVAEARNVTTFFDVLTRKGVKRNGTVIFHLDGFRCGHLAHQNECRNYN